MLNARIKRVVLATLLLLPIIGYILLMSPDSEAQSSTADAPAEALTSLPVEPLLLDPLDATDITATSGAIRVGTTTDLSCVVVFGKDRNFGNLTLDQDMGLSAHRDHFLVMRGLKPDTEYFYRLQGSDPNGNFYASRIMSFRTSSATAADDLGVNVALANLGARITKVSSNYGGGDNSSTFGANNAIDGDPDTEWSSFGDGDAAFITVELADSVEVSGFGLWTRTMGSSAQIGRFEVENEFGEVYGPFEIPDASGIYDFAAAGRGRTFTFRVVASSGGNTGVVEIAVYAQDR